MSNNTLKIITRQQRYREKKKQKKSVSKQYYEKEFSTLICLKKTSKIKRIWKAMQENYV